MVARIKQIIEKSGLSDAAFSKKVGVQQMTLWRQVNGTRKLSLETVAAIANAYPEIDCNWLIRGDGPMYISTDRNDERLNNLIDVISMQQETIRNLMEKVKQLQNN
jgi:transcriptional regulator with XRE-family HTH domain